MNNPSWIRTEQKFFIDKKELQKEIGIKVKTARERRNLTQAELSSLLGGISRSHVVNIEAGKTGISIETLYEIALALNVSVVELLPDFEHNSK